MKKSNVTVIAAVLIALHVGIFILFIGARAKKPKPAKEPTAPVTRPELKTQSQTPPPSKFEIPELNLLPPEEPKPAPAAPKKTVQSAPLPKPAPRSRSGETIASPGNRDGYLRRDLPDRRTSKVYSSLVGKTYASAIVIDARTGKILFEDQAHSYAYPASVTKLMTLLVTLEQIDAGMISPSDKVAITKEVAEIGGSEVYLDPRESGCFTVDDLLKALMIHSANDAARALALHVGGTRELFVDMMNQKARELGMNSTVYHSEHGLPPSDGEQPDISTAYDIAILSLACLRHPQTLNYTGTKLTYLPLTPLRKDKFMLANRNALIGKDPYEGCDGLKTGYHDRGGWSLAATAQQNGNRVVSVVLGAPDKNTRNETTKKLLDKGFAALNR